MPILPSNSNLVCYSLVCFFFHLKVNFHCFFCNAHLCRTPLRPGDDYEFIDCGDSEPRAQRTRPFPGESVPYRPIVIEMLCPPPRWWHQRPCHGKPEINAFFPPTPFSPQHLDLRPPWGFDKGMEKVGGGFMPAALLTAGGWTPCQRGMTTRTFPTDPLPGGGSVRKVSKVKLRSGECKKCRGRERWER